MTFPKRKNIQDQSRKYLVIIGSRNPVKISCAEEAFSAVFGEACLVQGLNVDSGVDKQPFGDEETYRGAYNRAYSSKVIFPEADFWVGIEGGVNEMEHDLTAYAWIVVLDQSGKMGRAKTASFFLPSVVADLVKGGMELGDANDQIFQSTNSKQQDGAVGKLTHGLITRKELYRQSMLLALIPFISKKTNQI